MHQKFGRKLQEQTEYGYDFRTDFQVESYLRYGDHFVDRSTPIPTSTFRKRWTT